ncbi:small multidrug resistance family-3 protein [Paenibacillus sp. OV219]|nr:small multidrug resistance family-3 protein [Paenibacillus sp. OV219]
MCDVDVVLTISIIGALNPATFTSFVRTGYTTCRGNLWKGLNRMLLAIALFLLAGLAEIGGGYLVWQWLRESRSWSFGLAGSIILVLYGIIPTWQNFPSFGRVYAAYGGVFIILAVLWGWLVDRKSPDFYDWLGAGICILGVSVMLWAPRG